MKKGLKIISGVFFASLMFTTSCSSSKNHYESSEPRQESVYDEKDYDKIFAPTSLDFNDETLQLKWDNVTGANAYDVNVNGKIVSSNLTTNTYKINKSLFDKLKQEENYQIIISVRAKVLQEDGTVSVTSTYKSIVYSNSSVNSYIVSFSLLDNGTLAITGISGSAKKDDYNLFVIDEKYGGRTVSKIASEAFYNQRSLLEVSLPDTIEVIEDQAFSNCTMLKTINMPSSLKQIGDNAFANCSNLGKSDENGLVLPSTIESIGKSAFSTCQYRSIVFPETCNLEEISESAFEGCRETELTIPSYIKYIRKSAFKDNKSLLKITFAANSSLKVIEDEAFYSCYSTSKNVDTTLQLPASLETIGAKAFMSCKLKEVYLPKDCKLEEIGENAFATNKISTFGYQDEVQSGQFQIVNSLKVIKKEAFKEAFALVESKEYKGCSSIVLSDNPSLESIEENAFIAPSTGSTGLVNVDALNNISTLTFIDSTAFEKTQFIKDNANKTIVIAGILLQIDDALASATTLTLDSNIKYISNDIFKNKKYTSITLNEGLIGIYDSAFEKCNTITSISFPESLKLIGNNAFAGNKLSSIEFKGNNLETIGDGAFNATSKNDNTVAILNLPESVISIGANAFKNWSKLETVNVGNKLKEIKDNAFLENNLLESFNQNGTSSLESIGSKAFYGCNKLSNLDLGNSLINVGDSAFEGLSSFVPTIPESIETIGKNAFAKTGIKSLTLKGNIKVLSSGAFSGCASLTDVTIQEDAFKDKESAIIYANTFAACKALTTLSISSNIQQVQDNAFLNCTKLTSIQCDAVAVENNAFKNTKWESDVSNLNDGLVILGNKVLNYVGDEATLTIPEGVEIINANTFNASSVKEINIASSVKEISEKAFYNSSIEKITFAKNSNLQSIENSAFEKCYYLKSINLEDTAIVNIQDNAFKQANALNSISLPETLTNIGSYAFFETSISSVSFGKNIEAIGDYAFANIGVSKNLSSTSALWEVYELSLKNISFALENNKLQSIASYAFYNNNVTNLVLPDNSLTLGDYCFANSKSLKEFVLKDSYTTNVFILQGASSIEKLELNGNVKVSSLFGGYSANVPTSLKEVTVNANSTIITANFLNGCGMVEKVNLPSTIKEIRSFAFANCRLIKDINIENVESIGDEAFLGCLELTNISYSNHLSNIGTKVFMGTKWLDESKEEFIVINNILIKFNNINNIEDVVVSDNIVMVAGGAFTGDNTIKSITFGQNIVKLNSGSFDSCTNLHKIVLNTTHVVNIDLYIFDTLSSFTVDVNNDIIDEYKENVYWSLYSDLLK